MGIPQMKADTLSGNWWVVALRGAAAILFGILTLFAPAISLAALVLLFGAYAFADGILAIVTAIRRRGTDKWWVFALQGIAGIAAGIITLFMPGITALVLLYLIAARALIVGVLEISAAIRLRKVIEGEWLMALSGIASIVFAGLLVMFPGPGALAVVLWIGAFSIVIGAVLVGLAFRLRSWGQLHPGTPVAAV